MICACIRQSKVVGLIQFENDEQYQDMAHEFEAMVDCSNYAVQPQIGWDYDSTTDQFNYGQLNSRPSIKLTKLAFRSRFTTEEKGRITGFAFGNLTNANATIAGYAASVLASLNDQRDATFIDLCRPDLVSGLTSLVALGLISSGRVTAILTTPPTFDETYRG